jgi:hypothetical protein
VDYPGAEFEFTPSASRPESDTADATGQAINDTSLRVEQQQALRGIVRF